MYTIILEQVGDIQISFFIHIGSTDLLKMVE